MKPLPMLGRIAPAPQSKVDLKEYEDLAFGLDPAACSVDEEGCLTCGDVAVPVRVTAAGGFDVTAVDARGNEGRVAVDLIEGPVKVGDRLLVHAGTAISRVAAEAAEDDQLVQLHRGGPE